MTSYGNFVGIIVVLCGDVSLNNGGVTVLSRLPHWPEKI